MILRPERTPDPRNVVGPELVYTLGGSDTEYYICRSISKSRYGDLNANLSVGYYDRGLREDTFHHSATSLYEDFIFRPPEHYRKLMKLRSSLVLLKSISDPIEIYEAVANQEI
jgi:hypothetical protein